MKKSITAGLPPEYRRVLDRLEVFHALLETEVGGSLADLGILTVIADGPVRMVDIAGRTGTVKSNMTQAIDRLEKRGLAKRVPNFVDRRGFMVKITPSGEYELDLARERFAALNLDVLLRMCGIPATEHWEAL